MADLLSHFLVAYVLLTIFGWTTDWLERNWVLVGVGGAAIPDLTRLYLLVDPYTIKTLTGVWISYAPFATLGGVLVVSGCIAVCFRRPHWRRAYGLLVFGGVTALLFDGLRAFADGRASAWLYPFTDWRPPTPSLYTSADPRVLAVTLVCALTVLAVDRRRRDDEGE